GGMIFVAPGYDFVREWAARLTDYEIAPGRLGAGPSIAQIPEGKKQARVRVAEASQSRYGILRPSDVAGRGKRKHPVRTAGLEHRKRNRGDGENRCDD